MAPPSRPPTGPTATSWMCCVRLNRIPMKKLILLCVLFAPLCVFSQTVTDLSDPGSNGVVYRNGLGTTRIATNADCMPGQVVDMRCASVAAGSNGVRCDDATNDTAAIQAYFNYYGKGGAGESQGVTL